MDYVEKFLNAGFAFVDEIAPFENVRLNKKYKVICPNGHQLLSRFDNIVLRLSRKSKGCPECNKENIQKEKDSLIAEYLPKEFKILSSYRKDIKSKKSKTREFFQLECQKGHVFERESGRFKNSTCPKCSEQIFVGQERTRKIFEEVFKVKFLSIRPDWLKNPKTGKNLELDGYNENLKIAFEFQGRQHSSNDTEFHGEFEDQKRRDQIKKTICDSLGVKLIEIYQPNSYNQEKFIDSVFEQIKEQVFIRDYIQGKFDFNAKKFNFKDLTFDQILPNVEAFLYFCAEEAPVKGYACLTTDFNTYEDKIEMICPEGHHFETTPAEFKRNILGKKGRDIPCITCYGKTNIINTKIDLNYCIEEGKKYGLALLSKEYINVNEKMSWEKEDGSIIELTFRQIQRSKTKRF